MLWWENLQHIAYVYLLYNKSFFPLSQEAGEQRRILLLTRRCTVDFCTFPPNTSYSRWLKRSKWIVNPSSLCVCLQCSRCFPSDMHKRSLFLLPGLFIPKRSQVILVSGWSCHCESKHLTAIGVWQQRRPCKKPPWAPCDGLNWKASIFHMLIQLRVCRQHPEIEFHWLQGTPQAETFEG